MACASQKGHGLERGNFESSSATQVLAVGHIIDPYQVGPGFGEAHAVFLVCMRRQRILFASPDPPDFVSGRLATKRAVQSSRLELVFLSKKVTLFHNRCRLEHLKV